MRLAPFGMVEPCLERVAHFHFYNLFPLIIICSVELFDENVVTKQAGTAKVAYK